MNLSAVLIFCVCCQIVGDLHQDKPMVPESTINMATNRFEDSILKSRIKPALRLDGTFDVFNKTDYKRETIRFAVANHPPHLLLEPRLFGFTIDNVLGFGQAWDLLDAMTKFFNFRPSIVRSGDNSIGYKNASGCWQGVVGMLYRNEADVTLLPVILTTSRLKDIDFSVPLSTVLYGMLVRRPANSPKPDALLRPFSWVVWTWILGSMVIMGPFIHVATRVQARFCSGNHKLKEVLSLSRCVWFVYGAMMKQGTSTEPVSDTSRILFASWWIYTVIVTAFYTANLTAFLTFNGLELLITDVTSLGLQPQVSWLAPFDDAILETIESHPHLEVLRKMQAEGRGHYITSVPEAMELVRNGTHVYIDEITVLDYLIYSDFVRGRQQEKIDKCDFYTVRLENSYRTQYPFIHLHWGFGFTKNSSLKNDFDIFFRRLNSFGILNFLHQNYSSSRVCEIPKGFKDRPLRNKDLLTTYLMILVGGILGTITFIIECIRGKTKSSKKAARRLFWKTSLPPQIRNDKSSFSKVPIFHDQFVLYSRNFHALPENRRGDAFPLTYPTSLMASNPKGPGPLRPKYKRKIFASKREKSRNGKELQATEVSMGVADLSGLGTRPMGPAIVEGNRNGSRVF